ncbi:tetratricopeptide repeat-containing sulfotransferase family protein [Rhodophyticola porphyridii]|uniref:tetratricopeptide repeat-containing sulfotransferase family protein n=1 Tax=Rhodophyticola porphyridii TaxID=1852017 RepID=UPI0011C3A86F|nr:sulfotransferase [Rhodophyticola porphyridii]
MANDSFESHVTNARALASNGDLVAALTSIDQALVAARQAQLFRSRLLQGLDRPLEALEEVIRLDKPDASPKFLEFRADLEEYLYRIEDAVATLTRRISRGNVPVSLLVRRALLVRALGNFNDAVRDLDRAIQMKPLEGELYRLRSDLVKAQPGDGSLDTLASVAARVPSSHLSAVHLHFARAKVLEDLGDFPAAFRALERGNQGMRAHFPYQISTRLRQVAAVRKSFDGMDMVKMTARASSDFAPIFITGMARSGTTLLEQILTAHPDVQGGGEAALLSRTVRETIGPPEDLRPGAVDVTPKGLADLADRYSKRMLARFGPAPRHTDKSLQTLLYAGPVLAAMPKSHIVLMRRDPRAVAISLYKQVFRRGKQLFSYNLDDIRQYQDSFDALVDFWQSRLNARFHVVAYEDIVQAPEPTIRSLLKRLNLSWTEACLRPEDNAQPIQTLSSVAVRQPINRDGLDRWRPYAPMMGYTVV